MKPYSLAAVLVFAMIGMFIKTGIRRLHHMFLKIPLFCSRPIIIISPNCLFILPLFVSLSDSREIIIYRVNRTCVPKRVPSLHLWLFFSSSLV